MAMPQASTLSLGCTQAELVSPLFNCIIPPHDQNSTVTSGRYVHTYDNISDPANAPPPGFSYHGNGHYSTLLNTTSYQSFGVFYCAFTRQDGHRTVIPTIFIRSDAKFIPAKARFTKTVNAGDENVSVDFAEVSPSSADKIWRLHGNTIHSEVLSSRSSAYMLPGQVNTSNAGIYEIYLEGERYLARAGLIRLIVRACPAGRYNVSSGCSQTCPSCYNGGICDDLTGMCICALGFKGDNCQDLIDCEDEYCDWFGLGFQFCTVDPYGCSCVPGYKGLDCLTECEHGEFGAGCTEMCHCVSRNCDRLNGVCAGSTTECDPGWTGVNCQECHVGRYGPNCDDFFLVNDKANKGEFASFNCIIEGGNLISTAEPVFKLYRKFGNGSFNEINVTSDGRGVNNETDGFRFLVLSVKDGEIFYCALSDVNNFRTVNLTADGEFIQPQISNAPVVIEATNDSVTLRWDAWNPSRDTGDPPLERYHVYYRRVTTPSDEMREFPKTTLDPSETVTGLNPDTDYVFGVAAARPGPGGRGATLEVQGRTKCLPPSGIPTSLTASPSELQGSLLVKWQNPPSVSPSSANCRSGYTGVRIYWQAVGPHSVVEDYLDVHLNSFTGYLLTSLDSNTKYVLSVSMLNRDVEGRRSENCEAMTVKGNSADKQYSVNTVLSSSLVPSTIALLVIIFFIIYFLLKRLHKERQPRRGEYEITTVHGAVHNITPATIPETSEDYMELSHSERVDHDYEELGMRSRHPDNLPHDPKDYVNVPKRPIGRKNFLARNKTCADEGTTQI